MPKQLIKSNGYKQLVKKIQNELNELDFFIRRRTAECYWRIGKYIHEHLHENKERAGYGKKVYDQLIKDVDRDKSTLQRAVQFYRTYPIVAVPRQLTWDHYRNLITVHDKTKREKFEKIALEREWTAEQLGEAIRLDRLKIDGPDGKLKHTAYKLSVTRSKLYTYQIIEPSYIHPIPEHLVVDLGFKFLIHSEMRDLSLKAGEIIESEKNGNKYSFQKSQASKKELFTYKALIERVVDADTICLNVDLGFSCWSPQRIRLRGIDCPEIDTKKGREAKEFVEARLKEVDFVVAKTYKDRTEKYGRYLLDIFYLKGTDDQQEVLTAGIFLNQELLDVGLANRMEG